MTVDFVPFATGGGALVEAQATYVADPITAQGFQVGIADPAIANKALRQGAWGTAGLAGFVNAALGADILDDANLAGWITNIENALLAYMSLVPVGAFINTLRNATFSIASRGSTLTVAAGAAVPGVYTLDGWLVQCSGASVTAAQAGSIGQGPNSLQITGQAGVTGVNVWTILESINCFKLSGKNVLFQVRLLNNTGSPVTPLLTVKTAGNPDDWSVAATTIVSAHAMQTVNNGVNSVITYAFAMPTSAVNGVSIRLDFGASINGVGKNFQLGDPDLRAVGASTSSFSVIQPSPELRAYFMEFLQCARYLPAYNSSPFRAITGNPNQIVDGSAFVNNTGLGKSYGAFKFATPTRAAPTSISISAASDFWVGDNTGASNPCVTIVFVSAGYYAVELYAQWTTSTNMVSGGSTLLFASSTSARLLALGAELSGVNA